MATDNILSSHYLPKPLSVGDGPRGKFRIGVSPTTETLIVDRIETIQRNGETTAVLSQKLKMAKLHTISTKTCSYLK